MQRYEFAAANLPPRARVLDVGCGVGYGSALLAERGALSVVAVDLSAEAIDLARRHFDRPAITWIVDDAHMLTQVDSQEPFDLICNLENLEHLADPDRFLARARALLKEGGALVTSTPNRVGVNRMRGLAADAPSPNRFHQREYSLSEFHALLTRHFDGIRFAFQTLDPLSRLELEPAVTALWHNPAVRLGRWLQRALRRRPVPERIKELLAPRRYQILERDPGDALVLTQLAICTGPRRERM